jgi:hypothetical protein
MPMETYVLESRVSIYFQGSQIQNRQVDCEIRIGRMNKLNIYILFDIFEVVKIKS